MTAATGLALFTPNALLHGSGGPTDHPEPIRVVRHHRIDGTKIVTVERADGSWADFHGRYVTETGLPCTKCGGHTVTCSDRQVCVGCGTEFYEWEHLLCPVDQWCPRCGPQAVCPGCKGN